MVPYVRMSFWKHYIDGIKYIAKGQIPLGLVLVKPDFFNKIENESGKVSIESEEYKNAFPEVYKYAMGMTEREVYQAVEGLFHNLNVLGRLNSNVKNIAI